jgi:hypothetical protein
VTSSFPFVDLVRAYSNPSDQVEHLRSLLELPREVRRERRQRPPKQAQTRLDPEAVAQLVTAYQAGGRVKQLARQFRIHRLTVSSILQREGVPLRSRGIHPDDLPEMIRLYRGQVGAVPTGGQVRGVTKHREQHPAPSPRADQTTGATADQPVERCFVGVIEVVGRPPDVLGWVP